MKGKVLDFNLQSGEGLISGDDGNRYSFVSAEWKSSDIHPIKGAEVDFTVTDGEAKQVYVTHKNVTTFYAPETSAGAIVSMVFGVVGVLFSWWLLGIPSIIAIISGHMALTKIKRSDGKLAGDGFAITGLVLGYLMLSVYILIAFVFIGTLASLYTIG